MSFNFNGFYQTWLMLDEKVKNDKTDCYLIPWIVNGAFACEVGIKYILAQNQIGFKKEHLFAYLPEYNQFHSYRVDYLSNVKLEEPTPRFDELRAELDRMQSKMWGVSVKRNKWGVEHLEHVEFTVKVEDNEEYIVKRLEREKRVGTVEKIDENTYRFSADVYDSSEMIPWIRTFICRIIKMNFSNRSVENQFKKDLEAMYICQKFAERNRAKMAEIILERCGWASVETFQTIHNYIDVNEMILRKGAVAAKAGEKLLVPINMRDGSLICIGKGKRRYVLYLTNI